MSFTIHPLLGLAQSEHSMFLRAERKVRGRGGGGMMGCGGRKEEEQIGQNFGCFLSISMLLIHMEQEVGSVE